MNKKKIILGTLVGLLFILLWFYLIKPKDITKTDDSNVEIEQAVVEEVEKKVITEQPQAETPQEEGKKVIIGRILTEDYVKQAFEVDLGKNEELTKLIYSSPKFIEKIKSNIIKFNKSIDLFPRTDEFGTPVATNSMLNIYTRGGISYLIDVTGEVAGIQTEGIDLEKASKWMLVPIKDKETQKGFLVRTGYLSMFNLEKQRVESEVKEELEIPWTITEDLSPFLEAGKELKYSRTIKLPNISRRYDLYEHGGVEYVLSNDYLNTGGILAKEEISDEMKAKIFREGSFEKIVTEEGTLWLLYTVK